MKSSFSMLNRIRPSGVSRHSVFAMLVTLVSTALLVGCSGAEGTAERQRPCPRAGILAGADRVTLFSDRGLDLTDIIVEAELDRLISECDYDSGDGIIYTNLAFDGLAEIGPAATEREITLPVFVAITETNVRVTNKKVFEVPLQFGGAQRRIRFVKDISDIELPFSEGREGDRYEILVGFQLTHEQRAYNRATD